MTLNVEKLAGFVNKLFGKCLKGNLILMGKENCATSRMVNLMCIFK